MAMFKSELLLDQEAQAFNHGHKFIIIIVYMHIYIYMDIDNQKKMNIGGGKCRLHDPMKKNHG